MTVDAILFALFLAFVALGYALIYSILRFVNLAHGDIAAGATFLAYATAEWLELRSLPSACAIAAGFGAVLGWGLYAVIYRPIARKGPLGLVVASLAAGLTIRALLRLGWGSRSRGWPLKDAEVTLLGVTIYARQVWLLALGVLVFVVLGWALKRTVWGLAVRAHGGADEQVRALGIDSGRHVAFTFALAGAVAALAGVPMAVAGGLGPDVTASYSLWAFAGSVVGGLGSLAASVLGAIGVGLVLWFLSRFLGASFADATAFLACGLAVSFRPFGLFVPRRRNI